MCLCLRPFMMMLASIFPANGLHVATPNEWDGARTLHGLSQLPFDECTQSQNSSSRDSRLRWIRPLHEPWPVLPLGGLTREPRSPARATRVRRRRRMRLRW